MILYEDVMNKIDIKNESLLKILEECSSLINSPLLRDIKISCDNQNMDDWVSEKYLNNIVSMGRKHDGFPVSAKSFSLQVGQFNLGNSEKDLQLTRLINNLNVRLIAELGVRNNALFMVYPPGGYISWHNNANASGYNVLLTWSEKGDGAWQHVNPKTGEIVTIPDVKGWQCKYGFYGQYDDGDEKLVYHCAYTNCWRMTIAFVYNRDEIGRNMAEMLLEDISQQL